MVNNKGLAKNWVDKKGLSKKVNEKGLTKKG